MGPQAVGEDNVQRPGDHQQGGTDRPGDHHVSVDRPLREQRCRGEQSASRMRAVMPIDVARSARVSTGCRVWSHGSAPPPDHQTGEA